MAHDHQDIPAFSRPQSASKNEGSTELRYYVSDETARQLDAILMVNGLQSRADYLVPLLEKNIRSEFHKAIILLRTARINPLDSNALGDASE